MWKLGCAVSGLLIGALPVAALAQDAPAGPEPQGARPSTSQQDMMEGDEGDDIVVTGQQPHGSVPGDIPPEQVLSPADVRAYGVSSIAELLAELAPLTASARGRGSGGPVVLLSGRRISSFSEIRDIPTEAIQRVDILPEEAALKLGYRADQRVVNIVLRRRFHSITGELTGRMPAAGGRTAQDVEVGVLRIADWGRANLNVEYNGASRLLESDRNVVSTTSTLNDFRGNISASGGGEIDPALSTLAGTPVTVAGVPVSAALAAPTLSDFIPTANAANTSNLGRYRTLSPATQQVTINGVYSRNLTSKISATLNAQLDQSASQSLLGPASATLRIPAGNPWSPFGTDVQLNRYYDALGALGRSSNQQTAHLGLTVNGDAARWRWSITGNYDRVTSETYTDTGLDPAPLQAALDAGSAGFNPFGALPASLIQIRAADQAHSTSSIGSLDAQLSGPLFELPAGNISTSLRVTGKTTGYSTSTLRAGIAQSGKVSRDSFDGQLNVDVPIASRLKGVLDAIGDLTLNGNVEVEQLSDFGTLTTVGYGANWAPVKQVRLLFSVTHEQGEPSAQQIGDPTVYTPNVRVFDYVRGETVDVTTITGGNRGLTADNRHVTKIGLSIRPFASTDLGFRADYVRSTIRNAISSFPARTAAIEAAFPDRFLRDGDGTLLRIDNRPVNFARNDSEQLRWGFNLSLPIKSTMQRRIEQYRHDREEAARNGTTPPPNPFQGLGFGRRPGGERGDGQGAPPPSAEGGQPGASGGFGGGAGRPGGGRGFGGAGRFERLTGPNGPLAGRIMLSVFHTWHFRDSILIRPGLPTLDLLDGSATGSSGGQPRHEIEADLGATKNGVGMRLSANWQSGTRVQSGALGSTETLHFHDFTKVNLRLFANLGQQVSLVRKHPWLRGTRVTFGVENLFDARQRVTDGNGVVPLSYQPDLVDPMGRTLRISFRKLFF